MARLIHDNLGLAAGEQLEVEVWSDPPPAGKPPAVVLYVSRINSQNVDETVYCDLWPDEARALAALLVKAAAHQERRSA